MGRYLLYAGLDYRLCHKMAEMHFPGLLIASAKFWSMMGASHQPTFMSGCLTISHMCLPCLPK